MKKMGYNWNEKECTKFLEQGGAKPKKKFKNIDSRHWVVSLPKQSEHKKFFQKLRDDGIGVNLHYIPVHCHPYYGKLGFKKGDFPNSEDYYNRSISIPLYFGLSEENQKYIIDKINSYFL